MEKGGKAGHRENEANMLKFSTKKMHVLKISSYF
jgi:hypothetical protein